MTKIAILQGDITKQNVDCIVNAANKSLLGGGGVDGAIHKAAGLQLLDECKRLGGCETGEAKITKGYKLFAKYIIHTVGPVYSDYSKAKAEELLARCYTNSLLLAKQHSIKTIAFPAISTGVYGYPQEEAVKVVHKILMKFIKRDGWFDEIKLVLHTEEDKQLYDRLFK